MPITVKEVSEMLGKDVFTDKGFYCGKVNDVEFDLQRYKVRSLVITAARGTFLGNMVTGKKGVIVPYPMVYAVGDIVVIKHFTTPPPEEGEK